MNYVKQLNAFMEKSIGRLNAKEQAMYLRLFNIANKLKWRDWFDVADSQLMHELMISRNTLKGIRDRLVASGFVQTSEPANGKMRKYHLIDLEDAEKVEHTLSKIDRVSKIDTGGCQKLTGTLSKIEHIINNKHKQCSLSRNEAQHNEVPLIGGEESELPNLSEDLKRHYENRMHNAPGVTTLEQLAILEEAHTKERVIKAIDIAARKGVRYLDFVAGILNRSKIIGYTDLDKKGGRRNDWEQPAKRYTGQADGETPEEYIERLNREYAEADRNQEYLKTIQPYTGDDGGTSA